MTSKTTCFVSAITEALSKSMSLPEAIEHAYVEAGEYVPSDTVRKNILKELDVAGRFERTNKNGETSELRALRAEVTALLTHADKVGELLALAKAAYPKGHTRKGNATAAVSKAVVKCDALEPEKAIEAVLSTPEHADVGERAKREMRLLAYYNGIATLAGEDATLVDPDLLAAVNSAKAALL